MVAAIDIDVGLKVDGELVNAIDVHLGFLCIWVFFLLAMGHVPSGCGFKGSVGDIWNKPSFLSAQQREREMQKAVDYASEVQHAS